MIFSEFFPMLHVAVDSKESMGRAILDGGLGKPSREFD